MLVLKYTTGYKYHLVDPTTDRAKCGRDAHGWFTFYSSGYGINWENDGHEHCSQCGTAEEFQAVSDQELEAYREMEAEKNASLYRAKMLAEDKAAVLKLELWPAVKEALRDAGLDVKELEPKGALNRDGTLVVTAEAGGHTFHFKVTPPSTSYGTCMAPPFEVSEGVPSWAREVS